MSIIETKKTSGTIRILITALSVSGVISWGWWLDWWLDLTDVIVVVLETGDPGPGPGLGEPGTLQ